MPLRGRVAFGRPLVLSALLLAMFVLSGILACEDAARPIGDSGSIAGTVTDVEGRPVHGAAISLVETASFRIVAGPFVTNATGHYEGERIPPGRYGVLIHGAGEAYALQWTHSVVEIQPGSRAVEDITLLHFTPLPSRYRIRGTVRDAVSHAPVVAAHVGAVYGYHEETETLLRGYTSATRGVTGADGTFEVSAGTVPWFGPASGLEPISVSAPGYEPVTLVGRGPNLPGDRYNMPMPALPFPELPDSVLQVTIELRPLAASSETGVVRGIVKHQGVPVVGVRVYLSLSAVTHMDTLPQAGTGAAKAGVTRVCVPLPDHSAVTDADGSFFIDRVPPGRYNAAAGYEPGDGFEPEYLPVGGITSVAAGDTAVIELSPYKALLPLAPLDGSVVTSADSSVELQWEPLPLEPGWVLSGYSVFVVDSARTHRTLFTQDPHLVVHGVAGGLVRWSVFGSVGSTPPGKASGGVFERQSVFRMRIAP